MLRKNMFAKNIAAMFILILLSSCMILGDIRNAKYAKTKKGQKKSKAKCLLLIRVSTSKQKKGASPKIQKKWGYKKAEELKAEIVKTINVGVSGKNWLKEYEDEISGIIKQEKIDYVLVYNINRFTRKLSLGVETLNKMLNCNCTMVTSSEIINPESDLLLPHIEMAIAEHNRKNIVEKGEEGTLALLVEGKYPFFKRIPLGIKINKNKNSSHYREASIDTKYKPFLKDLHNSIDNTENFAESAREMSDRYKGILRKPLSADNVKSILTNPIYSGFFNFKRKLIGKNGSDKIPHPKLRGGIDLKRFNKTKKTIERIYNKRRKRSLTPLRDALSDLIETHGFDVVINNLDDMLVLRCKKCHSRDLTMNGPEVQNGHLVQKYTCRDNNHQFRFPSVKQLKNLRSLDPRRCPRCGSADDFTVTRSVLSDYFQVSCNKCKYTWLAPVSDGKFKKLFDQQHDAEKN